MTTPPNYTQVPNEDLDEMKLYSPSEFMLLLALDRLTFGFHRNKVTKSLSELESMTGLSRNTLLQAAKGLEYPNPDAGRPAKIRRLQIAGKTCWERIVDWPDQPDEQPSKRAAKAPRQPAGTKQPAAELYPLAQAIAEVTNSNLELDWARIFSEAKRLSQLASPEEIVQLFGKEGTWYKVDWRGQKGDAPSISQVRTELSRLKARAAAGPALPLPATPARRPTTGQAQVIKVQDGVYL